MGCSLVTMLSCAKFMCKLIIDNQSNKMRVWFYSIWISKTNSITMFNFSIQLMLIWYYVVRELQYYPYYVEDKFDYRDSAINYIYNAGKCHQKSSIKRSKQWVVSLPKLLFEIRFKTFPVQPKYSYILPIYYTTTTSKSTFSFIVL